MVVRFINETSYQRSFLNKADQVLTWRSREIVPILGIIIVSPVGLVSEYMPLGSLDIFLRSVNLSIGTSQCFIITSIYVQVEQGRNHR